MDKVKLEVLGLSYTQTQSGAYILILAEEGGERRLPVVISASEAQSIAFKLENFEYQRPLTHDLFLSLASAYNIKLKEVIVTKVSEGIFYSELVCTNQNATVKIDSRTSDAVALALRFNCPIYASEKNVMQISSVLIDKEGRIKQYNEESSESKSGAYSEESKFFENMTEKDLNEEKNVEGFKKYVSKQSVEELESLMKTAAENEYYQKAAIIRDALKNKENDDNNN